jgi:hypothetical protein
MRKTVQRLKVYPEKPALAIYFDHWRKWLAVKRLFKFHLRFANARAQPLKGNLYHAFNKLKSGHLERSNYLSQ